MQRFLACILVVVALSAHAQQPVISLYKGAAPGSETWKQKEAEFFFPTWGIKLVRNVTTPTLTAYLPEAGKATGTAVIVAPGGGFRFLSWESEGTKVAEWLQAHGVAAFVLKYRVADMGSTDAEFQKKFEASMSPPATPNNSTSRPMPDTVMSRIRELAQEDGRQAVAYVRRQAAQYGINPEKIGMIGFSAGGMVTMGVAQKSDADSHLNFIGNIYGPSFGNIQVPTDAPPLFFTCAADDALAAGRAADLYKAWLTAGKSVEFHVYSAGNHGFGMRKLGLPVDTWIDRFGDWMGQQGFLKPTLKASQK